MAEPDMVLSQQGEEEVAPAAAASLDPSLESLEMGLEEPEKEEGPQNEEGSENEEPAFAFRVADADDDDMVGLSQDCLVVWCGNSGMEWYGIPGRV